MPDCRVALVTGAGRGIGRAIALRLGTNGAKVAVNYAASGEAALDVVREIEEAGGRALAIRADVGDAGQVAQLFAEIEQRLGPVDILINNAGVHRGGRVEKLSLADFDLVLRTSLYGSFNCCARAVPHMKKQGWGRIVTIASPAAVRAFSGDVAYASAKAGQLGLTRTLAVELGRDGITANAVLPGFVETDMTASLSDKSREAIARSIPQGHALDPDAVARAVAYLASEDAPDITGVVLPVDGGITL